MEIGTKPSPEECCLFQVSTVGYLVFVVLKFLPGRSSSLSNSLFQSHKPSKLLDGTMMWLGGLELDKTIRSADLSRRFPEHVKPKIHLLASKMLNLLPNPAIQHGNWPVPISLCRLWHVSRLGSYWSYSRQNTWSFLVSL